MNNIISICILLVVILIIFLVCKCHQTEKYTSDQILIPNYNTDAFPPEIYALQEKYRLGTYKGGYELTEYGGCCGVQPIQALPFNPGLKDCEYTLY
jgi:hypothetical protein